MSFVPTILRSVLIDFLGKNVTEVAEDIGLARPNVSRLLSGKMRLMANTAVRIERAYNLKVCHLLHTQVDEDIRKERAKLC